MPKTAVVMCSDANGLPYACHVASHVATLHPKRQFDILIASTEPLDVPEIFLKMGVKNLVLPNASDIADIARRAPDFLPPTNFLRLWLPEALQHDYHRYLYLDIDLLVVGGDLERLLASEIGSHPFAAVRDIKQWTNLTEAVFEFGANGLPGHPYFNAGVVLVDVARWLEQDLTGKIIAESKTGRTNYTHEQGFLNMILKGDWAELHPAWNWHQTRGYHALLSLTEPNIIHFAGFEKPWHTDEKGLVHDRLMISNYASFLGQHFPQIATRVPERSPKADGLKSIAERAASAVIERWAMRRYLSRFQDCYDVLTR